MDTHFWLFFNLSLQFRCTSEDRKYTFSWALYFGFGYHLKTALFKCTLNQIMDSWLRLRESIQLQIKIKQLRTLGGKLMSLVKILNYSILLFQISFISLMFASWWLKFTIKVVTSTWKKKLEKKEEIKSKKMEYTELSQFVTRIGSLVQTNYIGNFTTEFPIYVQRK